RSNAYRQAACLCPSDRICNQFASSSWFACSAVRKRDIPGTSSRLADSLDSLNVLVLEVLAITVGLAVRFIVLVEFLQQAKQANFLFSANPHDGIQLRLQIFKDCFIVRAVANLS